MEFWHVSSSTDRFSNNMEALVPELRPRHVVFSLLSIITLSIIMLSIITIIIKPISYSMPSLSLFCERKGISHPHNTQAPNAVNCYEMSRKLDKKSTLNSQSKLDWVARKHHWEFSINKNITPNMHHYALGSVMQKKSQLDRKLLNDNCLQVNFTNYTNILIRNLTTLGHVASSICQCFSLCGAGSKIKHGRVYECKYNNTC